MRQPKSSRPTVKSLIVFGLGYCCEWAFFKTYKRTGRIADRLGVGDRAIRYHKRMFKDGELKCEGCTNCMKDRIA